MKKIILGFCLCLSALWIFSCQKPADRNSISNGDFAAVRSFILSQIEQNAIPSAAVAVARGGKIIWQEAFGWADKERKIRATPDTAYCLRSISKTITATGLMTLVKDGRISVDDALDRFLDPSEVAFAEFDGRLKDITLGNLLNHASGLQQHFYYYYLDEPFIPPSSSETIRRYGQFMEPPGRTFAYSNLGYEVLRRVIEKTTNEAFDAFLKERVFDKLGMDRSFVNLTLPHRNPGAAAPHDDKGNPLPLSLSDTPAAGDVYSSVNDLIKFGMFHLKDRLPSQEPILSDGLIDLMQSAKDPHVVNYGNPAEAYGWGWFFNETDYSRKTVWHEGGSIGTSTILKLIPSEGLAVAVLINTYRGDICNRIADDIIKISLPDYQKTKDSVKAFGTRPREVIRPRGAWAGTLKTNEKEIPITMVFQPDGDVIIETTAQFETKWVFPWALRPLAHRLVFNVFQLTDHWMFGWYLGIIPDADAQRYPHLVMLSLNRTPGRMSGPALVTDRTPRQHFGISYFVSLTERK